MKTNFIRLSGGLGNQLFQLSYGSTLTGKNIYFHFNDIDTDLIQRIPGVHPDFQVLRLGSNTIFHRLSNFSLRLINWKGAPRIFVKAFEVVVSVVASSIFKEATSFRQQRNLGFEDQECDLKSLTSLNIGYFQAHDYAVNLEILTSQILGNDEVQVYEKYRKLAYIEKPIAVQVRLGDYLKEDKFGVPGKSFFTAALEEIDNFKKRKLWIFSNDLPGVNEYLPNEFLLSARMIEELDASPVLMLFIMSLAQDFIISNSTFGWWGAFINQNESREVVVPMPWFRHIDSPEKLIPKTWKLVKADF